MQIFFFLSERAIIAFYFRSVLRNIIVIKVRDKKMNYKLVLSTYKFEIGHKKDESRILKKS